MSYEGISLESLGNGVWKAPGARIIDRSGDRRLPIGWDSYASVMGTSVIVDKSSLIADVLDSGYAAILFCRPLVTVELKYSKDEGANLDGLARTALEQIEARGYDRGQLPPSATGRVRWGIAIGGKRVSAACERLA